MKRIITFLVLLFGVLSSLMAQDAVVVGQKADMYLVGQFSSWAFSTNYQFTQVDEDDFVLEFTQGNELQLEGQFKIASNGWSGIYDFGGNHSVDIDTDYVLTARGANLNTAKVITVSKIAFNTTTATVRFSGVSTAKVFDVTKDYGLYLNADNTDNPFTFKGNGVYEASYTFADISSYQFNVGDVNYSSIELGGLKPDNVITFGSSYQMGETNYRFLTPVCVAGTELLFTLTITSDWTATILVTQKTTDEDGDDEGGDDPIVPETSAYVVRGNGDSDATGIWCGGIEWGYGDSPVNNMTDADEDGMYEVTYKNVPAGTWNFKVVGATEGWMGSDYLDTENSSAGYTTAPYDGNIGFTLNAPADVTIKFNTLTGKIIATTPSGNFGKVKIDHFHITIGSEDVCLDQYEFTEANNYTLTFTENIVVDPDYGYGYAYYRIIGNCSYAVYEKNFGIDVTVSGTYTVTIQFNGDYETPDFTIKADKATVTPPDDPNPVYPEIWLMGQVTGYQFLDEWKFNSTDGDNYVIEFTTPKELTSLFRIAGNGPIMENPSGEPIYSFSVEARTNIEANTAYTLLPHGRDNIGVEGIIEATRIEFQLSTGTFKVIGTSKAKVFDLTKDYNLCVNFDPAYPMTFKGNGVYTGTYVFPADAIGYKRSFVFGDVNDAVVAMGPTFAENGLAPLAYNTPIPLTTTYNSLATQHLCYGGDTFEFTLTFKSDWTASVVVSYIPNLEGRTYTVNGNGGSDATGIWCGGIEWGYGDSPVNNMTDADADGIYEVTYKNVPAGTWSFKVVALVNAVQNWMGSDYLDTKNSSAGCTTAPYDGNIGFTLNAPADVTIKYNILTGKIIVTTPSGSFGKVKIDHFHITTGSEDVCLDQYEFTEANNYTLTFTEDIVVNPEYGYGYAYYRIIGNCSYAVYEKSFDVKVTENGTYTVTVQFNGDYENPDFTVTAVKQGGSDEPIVKDPVISDIVAPTFPQIEVGETATATLTYTLENATSATATVEAPFYIQSQSVVNGKGTVEILFMPEAKGVHTATLSIKSGNVTETASLVAKAVDPKPEVLPVISNINVPAFADTYINATNVVTATYSLANATEATATISGTNADAFYILSQSVGSVKILFMPEAKGTYNAILTITSGKTTESVNLTAKAIEFIPEPEPAISNVNVPAFATIEIGNAANVTATFSLENATEVSATLSGTGADAFILGQPMVNNGNGSIKIAFVPENAGTYTATLTLKSGKTVHTATITAVATEPAPQVRIENIQVPVFEEVYLGGYTSVNVTYTLVNATKATVTVTGDVFSTGSNVVVGGKGTVPVDFMPETAGVHTATLTITAGGVSESVTLVAIAKLKSTDEPSGKVTISNIQVPEFASITAKETTTVTASYVLTGATSANASLSGTDAAYFTILSQTLSEGVGQVEIKFAPTVAREYNATLVVTSGSVTESIDFSATASEAPSISGLHVNDFGTVYVGEKVTVMANYSLAYAETATATLSGDTDVFAISRQMVSDGNGLVRIDFTPIAAGTYHATLTIKSGVSEESIDFSATAIKYEEPEIEPIISNLIVPEFGEVLIGETVQKIATYTLENATEATATLSGDNAFTITRTLNGAVRIMFAPTAAGTYNGTLTITSGTVSESISFSATAIKDEEPEIEPIISNLMVPEFGEVLIGETVQRIATYTLENATVATATLSGDAAFTITRTLNGAVRIMFAPTEAGTYSATLTITSGKVSESIDFSAKAVEEGGEESGPGPEDPVEPEKPDPLPEYPVRGYMYVVNTPDAHLEKMVKYKPVSIDKVDYFLAPEKTGQKIYGYDIYKFEVRDEEMIDLWEYPNAQYTSWHINVNADLSATPYLANGVWYASIEEMMTWYVRYIPNWDDEASEKMIVESPNVYVATFDAFAESDDNDKYYYCLGNVEDPILEVGVSEYGVIQNYLQIPQGFKAMIYLDDTNWETQWKTYYKLVPPGDDWNRDCIDLGLSSGLCWATKNLGATEPQQEGTHFAWGEVEPKEDYSYNTYKWANLLKNNEYIKYVTDDYWGTIVDFRTTLEPTDDAANVALEGKWHMPTQADVEELLRECTTEFGSYYGVNGYFVTGPNGNAIFLPAVGIKEGTDYEESTRGGDYWTSSLYEDNQKYAVTLSFALTYIEVDDMQRTNGLAIRPVINKDYVGIEEVVAINVYAKDHTIYCEEPFQIYTVTGLEVTHLNGALEGVYIVKTEKGNQLISVW